MMNTMLKLIVGTILVGAGVARAEIKMETIEYKDGETALEGVLAYDEAVKEPRPLVLVVHEWWGLNDYAKSRAKQLAGMGYTAFAVHAFTNPGSGTDPSTNVAYNENADKRSWEAMKAFLAEALK